ncbi:hypothetical protein [Cellulomonas sp. P5_C6]
MYVTIGATFLDRCVALITGAQPPRARVAWSALWGDLVQVRLAHRSATFLEENGDRCIFIAATANSFRPLREAIQANASYVNVSTTFFDDFVRLPRP